MYFDKYTEFITTWRGGLINIELATQFWWLNCVYNDEVENNE